MTELNQPDAGETCSASRHVLAIAGDLARDGHCQHIADEPTHCAESMLATVEALWAARNAARAMVDLHTDDQQAGTLTTTGVDVGADRLSVTLPKTEACARAMVQPAAPDMAEVERLVREFGNRVRSHAYGGQVRLEQIHDKREELLDYVRGALAERDALIADNDPLPVVQGLIERVLSVSKASAERGGWSGTVSACDRIETELRMVSAIWRRLKTDLDQAHSQCSKLAVRLAHNQFRDAAKMVPTAWQVWCGLGNMHPYWPVFRTKEEADDAAKTIKTYTEVRPLWSHASAAPQPVGEHGKSLARQPLTNPELDAWLDIHGPNGINSKKERS